MTTWRAKFWNTFLAIGLFIMAGIYTAVAFSRIGLSYDALNMAIFVPISVVLWAGFVRSLMLGVSAGPEGVTVRLLWHTVKVRRSEIDSISGKAGAGGTQRGVTGAALGTRAPVPVVAWLRR